MVALVCDVINPRVVKIAFGLNEVGWQPVLVHSVAADAAAYISFFSAAYSYSSPDEALHIVSELSPHIVHVFSSWDFKVATHLIHYAPHKVVFDNYDQLIGMLNPEMAAACPEQIESERFCIENAAGNCCRSLELLWAKRKEGYVPKGPAIFFPDYCWDFSDAALRAKKLD